MKPTKTMTFREETITEKIHKRYLDGEFETERAIEVAFEQGKAEGRAETKTDCENANKLLREISEIKKQAYEKGFQAGIVKGRKMEYDTTPYLLELQEAEKRGIEKGRAEKIAELKKEIEEGIYEKLHQEELDTWKKVKEENYKEGRTDERNEWLKKKVK
jgi:hypothetical protein